MTQRRGPRRSTRWIDTLVSEAVPNNAVDNQTLLGALGSDDIPGLTIIRTLVRLTIVPETDPNVLSSMRVIVGAGIITGDAFAAGALPDVNIDTDYPINGWMFKEVAVLQSSPGIERPSEIVGDYRSQRKLSAQTECFLSIRNDTVVGSAQTIRIIGLVRMLVKLP